MQIMDTQAEEIESFKEGNGASNTKLKSVRYYVNENKDLTSKLANNAQPGKMSTTLW